MSKKLPPANPQGKGFMASWLSGTKTVTAVAASSPAASAAEPPVAAADDNAAAPAAKKRRVDDEANTDMPAAAVTKEAEAPPSVPRNKAVSSSAARDSTAASAGSLLPAAAAAGTGAAIARWQALPDVAECFSKAGLAYHPLRDAGWPLRLERCVEGGVAADGGSEVLVPTHALGAAPAAVPYSALVAAFSAVEATASRLEKTAVLANFFRSITASAPDDLLPCLYLCVNAIAPAYEALELGVGDALLHKALASATGRSVDSIKAEAEAKGDLGEVAVGARTGQGTLAGMMVAKPQPASAREVYAVFHAIARIAGSGSQGDKVAAMARLLGRAGSGAEAKYVVRGLQGKLRIGATMRTVLVALAHAFAWSGPATPPAAGGCVWAAAAAATRLTAASSASSAPASAARSPARGKASHAAAPVDDDAAAPDGDEDEEDEEEEDSGDADEEDADDDDEDAAVVSKRRRTVSAATAKKQKKKKAPVAAGSGSAKRSSAGSGSAKRSSAGALTLVGGKLGSDAASSSSSSSSAVEGGSSGDHRAEPHPGLLALDAALLARLPADVRLEHYTLPPRQRAAVESSAELVPAEYLVFRRPPPPPGAGAGAAAPAKKRGAASSAAAGASSSGAGGGGAAAAAPLLGLPPAVVDWKAALGLAPERAAARAEAAAAIVKQVYSAKPSFDALVPTLLRGGLLGAADAAGLAPGVPVSPMLAKPTRGVREVLDRFEAVPFTCEFKYDGERAQVHIGAAPAPAASASASAGAGDGGGFVSIFSRNSENTTGKYPDVAAHLRQAMAAPPPAAAAAAGASEDGGSEAAPAAHAAAAAALAPLVTSAILDGEVVAYDRERGVLLPFQVLSTRARKAVAAEDIKVQVIYVAFDLLLLNGVSLLATPLRTRQALLRAAFTAVPGRFAFAEHASSSDVEEISTFLNDAVKGGCEGLMVKVLDGPESLYEPSRRSLNWLKLKKDYMDGLTDSLDLVPIGAWRGKGKRTGVYGAYLLACYDPEEEVYQAITKIGTGFSDEMLEELTKAMDGREGCRVASQPSNCLVGDAMAGDADIVWFDPDASEVWEVMAADLSISPVHKAALGRVDPAKGIALRFPRFLRRRDDKAPADATSADQVEAMYRGQSLAKEGGGGGGGEDDEDDE